MRIFISGGCKNGKSYYAQRLASAQGRGLLYYIATMVSTGEDDDQRIRRHRESREGWGFVTVEQPCDIEAILEKCDPSGSFLLDSATALLANEMFPPNGAVRPAAEEKIIRGLSAVLDRVENIVIVSDYIYGDAEDYDALSEAFRRSLARIDRTLAARCGAVLEVAYSNVVIHKEAGTDGFDIRRQISGQA